MPPSFSIASCKLLHSSLVCDHEGLPAPWLVPATSAMLTQGASGKAACSEPAQHNQHEHFASLKQCKCLQDSRNRSVSMAAPTQSFSLSAFALPVTEGICANREKIWLPRLGNARSLQVPYKVAAARPLLELSHTGRRRPKPERAPRASFAATWFN